MRGECLAVSKCADLCKIRADLFHFGCEFSVEFIASCENLICLGKCRFYSVIKRAVFCFVITVKNFSEIIYGVDIVIRECVHILVFVADKRQRCTILVLVNFIIGKNFYLASAESALIFAERLAGNERVGVAEMQISPVATKVISRCIQRILLDVAAVNGIIGSADCNLLTCFFNTSFC